ncbi:MAG: antibiotic biosynthesis monooxygenase [Pseudomonadota bacterium]
MIAVIFELLPAHGQRERYLDIAASLRAELEELDGFVSIERFESLSDKGKLLSLSFFEDEEAVLRWRNRQRHREAQAWGRDSIFADYRLRVASVIRDYGLFDREQVPPDSTRAHDDVAR